MRDYSKVSPQFWSGKTGKALKAKGPEAVVVAMYLLTCQHANMLGLYYLSKAYLIADSGLDQKGASKGLRWACEAGFCRYDEESEVVWIPEMAQYQIAERLEPSDKRCKGIQREYDSIPENPFLYEFYKKYARAFNMTQSRGEPAQVASPSEAPSKALRSQEQEQEQKQEQAQEQKHEQDGPRPDVAVEAFLYWQQVMGKPQTLFTEKREKAVRKALATGYTLEQIKQAIDGCKRSPYHQGNNKDRTVYDDLELICRDGEHIEKFMFNIGAGAGVETIDQFRNRIDDQAERVAAFIGD